MKTMFRTGGGAYATEIEEVKVIDNDSQTVAALYNDGYSPRAVIEPLHSNWCNYFGTWIEAWEYLSTNAAKDLKNKQALVDSAKTRLVAINSMSPSNPEQEKRPGMRACEAK